MMGVEGNAKAVPIASGANDSTEDQQEHKDAPAVGAVAATGKKELKLLPTLRCPLPPAGELFMPEEVEAARPAGMDKGEWKARVELAALYRIFYARGWDEEVINHISLRVPGPEHHYLLNPFGLYYGEVTATNLVKVDLEGNLVTPSPYTVNVAGFVIHSAVHGARPDVGCVIHTHSTAGTAVACKQGGLAMDNFYSVMINQAGVGYHDFEGITVRLGERERLVQNLGDKAILILRSHGLLVCGCDVAKAFFLYYATQRACEIQCAAGQIPGPNVPITQDVLQQGTSGAEAADPQGEFYWKMLAGAVRRAKITLQDLIE